MKAEVKVNYDAYWRRHPAEAERVERTAFFGRRYDYAVERCDWRALMALARWSTGCSIFRFWKTEPDGLQCRPFRVVRRIDWRFSDVAEG